MPTIVRLVVAVLALSLFAAHGTADTSAHAALERSDPPGGAVLPGAPTEIRLWFTEPLEIAFTGADLLDAAGTPVPGVTSAIAPENSHLLLVTLPADLPDGPYTVAWRTLSSADGHTLEGYFGFRTGEGGATAGQVASASTSDNRARELTRGLALVGLSALLALAPVTLLVLDPATRSLPRLAPPVASALRRYTVVAIALALLGSVAALSAQSAAVVPGLALPAAIGQTLAETRYGQFWLWRFALLAIGAALIVVALWGRANWRRPLLALATVLSLAMPVPFSLLSHAAAQKVGTMAAVASDALHLLLASVWAGGLFLLAVVLAPALPTLSPEERRAALRAAIPRFSALAIAAWAVLAVTGLYAAWLQVGTVAALLETDYGKALLLKAAVLVPTLVLAVLHFAAGRAGPGRGSRRIGYTLALEAALAILVLLVVGRLIGLEPGRESLAATSSTAVEVPLRFSTDSGVRTGLLTISPGAAGANAFTVRVDDAALPEKSEAVLRFTPIGPEIGEQELRLPPLGASRFAAEGDELALAGDWRITTIVRQIGAFSWTTASDIAIGLESPQAPVPNPAPLFAPLAVVGLVSLTVGLLALAVVAASGALASRPRLVAASGIVACAAGVALIATARISVPASATPPAVAIASTPVPPPATPGAVTAHTDHHVHDSTPEAAAALPGTPVASDGLTMTLGISAARAGAADLAVVVYDDEGSALSGARVVIAWEMPGMSGSRSEAPAVETAPGHYQVADAVLDMAGEWRVTARVSPRGQPTRIAAFTVEMR